MRGFGEFEAIRLKARMRYIKKFLSTTKRNRRAIVQKLKKHPRKLAALKRDVLAYKQMKKKLAKKRVSRRMLGDFEPINIPEALWVDKSKDLGDFEPFNIPEAIWVTKGFSDLLLL